MRVTDDFGGSASLNPDIAADSSGVARIVFEAKPTTGPVDTDINIYYTESSDNFAAKTDLSNDLATVDSLNPVSPSATAMRVTSSSRT